MPPAADSDGRDISEVYRVLRSGGRLVIYVTSRDTMQKWPFAGPNTHRTFDAHDLTNLLVSAGFSRSHIIITNAELALGVKGLMLTAGPRTAKSLAPSSAPHRPDVGSRSRRKIRRIDRKWQTRARSAEPAASVRCFPTRKRRTLRAIVGRIHSRFHLRSSARRYSIDTVRPSIQPRTRTRSTKPAVQGIQATEVGPKNQITERLIGSCIRLRGQQDRLAGPFVFQALYFSEGSGGALSGERRKCVACSNE
jgi:hypothetical protein